MSSIFDRAIAVGQRQLRRVAAGPASYVRLAGGDPTAITARKAFVRDEQLGEMNVPVRVERWRFTFDAASLVADGQVVRPQEGDEIHVIVGTETIVYRATPAGDGKPCWGWNDSAEREIFVDTVNYDEG